MRHQVYGRILGRKTNHRKAMFRNMAVSLFTHGQITTTLPKAKAVKPFIEKLISAAKKGDLASRRRVVSQLGGEKWMLVTEEGEGIKRNKYGELKAAPKITKHLFEVIAPQYKDRKGGYTRIIKISKNRLGDGADLCVLQLVGADDNRQRTTGSVSRRAKKTRREEFAKARLAAAAPAAAEEVPAGEEAAEESAE